MTPFTRPRIEGWLANQQRGIVLIIALMALLIMSLAAVALIRSVNTATMIAGNLAFKQSATLAGDNGIEAAMASLATVRDANLARNLLTDTTHPFNITNLNTNPGYHSSIDPTLNLFADATWTSNNSCGLDPNCANPANPPNGNTVRYIIQRACRIPNVAIQNADCLFSSAVQDKNGQGIKLPQDICDGPGCPLGGQAPMLRITSRITGPRNTVSYTQVFVY